MKKVKKETVSGPGMKADVLIAKAADLLARKGYRQCGVQEITDYLGLSKGGFYWYFESKEDLYSQICRAHCDRCRKAFYELIEKPGPVDPKAILATSRDLLDWFMSNPQEITLMFGFYHETGSSAVMNRLIELGVEWHRVLTILIQRCRDDGLITVKGDAAVLARIALVYFRGLLLDFNMSRDRKSALSDWELFMRNLFGIGV